MIALVFNVKEEASTQVSPAAGQATPPFTPNSLHPSASDDTNASVRASDLYAEWDTMETVNAVRGAIEERYHVVMVEANEEAFDMLRQFRPDFVFNIAEGLHGVSREAQMPAIMEMLRIPYLGSDPLTLAVCLDKSRAKEILSYYSIPTAPFTVIHSMEEFDDGRVKFPSIVKPLHEGSSKGIYNSCCRAEHGRT